MADLEARQILQAKVATPTLAYERCSICGDKQYDRFIEVIPLEGTIESLPLCGKCANRLVWILPRLVAQLGSK